MPYFITDDAEGCDGFATIKEDGEVIGCHQTKQEAIDQMVAVSIAEDIEPGGERMKHKKKKMKTLYRAPVGAEDKFATEEEALDRADEIGCEGTHTIDENGETVYMPCSTHAVYDALVNNLNDDEEDLEDEERAPAPKKDQIQGSDENKPDSAKGTGGDVDFDEKTTTALRNKVSEHNDDMAKKNKPDYTRTTLGQLKAVYRRGSGAYSTSHRPGVSRAAWSMARVNAFLYLLRNGRPENPKYITDFDLLPKGHPKSTRDLLPDAERVLPDNYRPSLSEDVPEGRACGNCYFYDESNIKEYPDGQLRAYCEKWDDYVDGAYYCNAWQPNEIDEERAVNLEAPAYMRAAARRGLELNRQGFGGDGLTDKTKQEARDMAEGRVSEDKWRRIAPWVARHLVDLDAPQNNNSSDPGYPGAGLVAHLLWGSGPSKRAAERTQSYAQSIVDQLDAEQNMQRWSTINVKSSKSEKEKTVNKVERRIKTDVDFELRVEHTDSDGMKFSGYAAVFNSDSEPLPFIETIMPGAFKRSLKARNEVKLFKNHNMDEVLASTRSKTLRLSEDSKGLLAEATLPDTTAGRDLAVLMKRGDVHSMSFGFSVPRGGDSYSDDGMTRQLKEIRLHEVSIVTGFPAYEATTATVRSLDILASRTNVDPDALADALNKLESGDKLPDIQADLLQEVVTKLRENVPSSDDLIELKRKQLDLLFKAV